MRALTTLTFFQVFLSAGCTPAATGRRCVAFLQLCLCRQVSPAPSPTLSRPFFIQMCTDGTNCKRRVCFFAHTENELRKSEEDPMWLQQQVQAELAAGKYRLIRPTVC